ncbi:MAG: hypothetical protein IPP79_18150 [Chitinophagaceae bacterium]|nr:hypothetical protein [Chitinophagaceae bacterium]
MAHKTLEYFENDEQDIDKPAYAFEISQAAAFAPAKEFIKEKFETKDSSSHIMKPFACTKDLSAFILLIKIQMRW